MKQDTVPRSICSFITSRGGRRGPLAKKIGSISAVPSSARSHAALKAPIASAAPFM
jgi:hypothetical protein